MKRGCVDYPAAQRLETAHEVLIKDPRQTLDGSVTEIWREKVVVENKEK
jgi:hypothetical protein